MIKQWYTAKKLIWPKEMFFLRVAMLLICRLPLSGFHPDVTPASGMKTINQSNVIIGLCWLLCSRVEQRVCKEPENTCVCTRACRNCRIGKVETASKYKMNLCERETGTYTHLTRVQGVCSCFWGHRKFRIFLSACQDCLLGGVVLFTAEMERADEGCSCPSLRGSICHWAAAFQVGRGRVRRKAEGETLPLLGFVKRHGGGWVCGATNTMRWIFLAVNLSWSAFMGINTRNTELPTCYFAKIIL